MMQEKKLGGYISYEEAKEDVKNRCQEAEFIKWLEKKCQEAEVERKNLKEVMQDLE